MVVGALAVLTMFRLVVVPVAKVKQGGERCIGQQDDRAARAPVPTVRPSARHVLLAPERGRSVASSAGLDMNFNLVNEHKIKPSSTVDPHRREVTPRREVK
jgi:hypothetical protein